MCVCLSLPDFFRTQPLNRMPPVPLLHKTLSSWGPQGVEQRSGSASNRHGPGPALMTPSSPQLSTKPWPHQGGGSCNISSSENFHHQSIIYHYIYMHNIIDVDAYIYIKKNVCVCVNLIQFIDTQASLLFALDMVGHSGTSIWHSSFQTSQVGWKVSKMLVKHNQSTNQLQLVNNSSHPPWQFNPHDSHVAECSKNSQSIWNHQPTTINQQPTTNNQLTTNINQPSVTDDTWPLSRGAQASIDEHATCAIRMGSQRASRRSPEPAAGSVAPQNPQNF